MTAPASPAAGPRRVYHGWWILAAAVLAAALGSGVSFWSYGLYIDPLESQFGWSRAEVSFGFSVSLIASGLSALFIGKWVDRYGPRASILLGTVLTAGSYLLLSRTSTLWQWYAFLSINTVFWQMMLFIPIQTLISRWFDRRRGMALGILGTGFSLGGFLVVPLMQTIIDRVGWEASFVFAAAAISAVYLVLALFVIRDHPADLGLQVDGAVREQGRPMRPVLHGLPLAVAARTPIFWAQSLGLTLFFFGTFGWVLHQVPYYESVGLSRQTGALIVSATAGMAIVSRLAFGVVADRLRRIESGIVVLCFASAAGMALLLVSSSHAAIAAFICLWVVGASGGSLLEGLTLTRTFGVAHFATILAAVFVVETIGQIISPTAAGAIFDATGSYDWVLAMFAVTFAAAGLLFWAASRMPIPFKGPAAELTTADTEPAAQQHDLPAEAPSVGA